MPINRIESIAHLQAARRYVTFVLLNLPVSATETSVANLLVLIDHFIANPNDYEKLLRSNNNNA